MSLIPTAFAQAAPNITELQQINLVDLMYVFVAIAVFAAGALSIAFIFFGGFSFILSGGDETKVKEAIHTIRYAIIGLIVTLLSLFVIPRLIGPIFHVNFSFLDFATLSDRMNILYQQFQTAAPAPQASSDIRTQREPVSASTTTQPATRTSVPVTDLIR